MLNLGDETRDARGPSSRRRLNGPRGAGRVARTRPELILRATCKLRARETPSGSQEPTHDPVDRVLILRPPELGRRLPLHQREPRQ